LGDSHEKTELLGYTQEEALGRTPFDFMPPVEAERVSAGFQRLASSKLPIIQEKNFNRRRDGRDVILETTGVPVLDADESLKGYRGISRDITDRQQAEEALRESEEKYRTVLEVNPDPVVVYDMEGTVIYLNPAFTRIFGWSLEEQIGKKIDGFVPEKNMASSRITVDSSKFTAKKVMEPILMSICRLLKRKSLTKKRRSGIR
jgi:PAS domain S-box-containing protein